jgi:hypothetical protein
MYCAICGSETETSIHRWWDCDDGWRTTYLCRYCWEGDASLCRPKQTDFAVYRLSEERGITEEEAFAMVSKGHSYGILSRMAEEEAIDTLFG